MAQRKEYKIAKSLINDGTIERFRELFDYDLPKQLVADDMDIHWSTLDKRLKDLGNLTLENLTILAEKLEIDQMTVIALAAKEYAQERKKKGKK